MTYMKMYKNVYFVVPLVSRLLPADTCKISKKGPNIRFVFPSLNEKNEI